MTPQLIFLSTLLFGLSYGQSPQQEWSPDELDNPVTHALKCGFSSSEPAYICDPNGILGEDVKAINWVLRDATYNATKCPCSTYHCETARQPTGYKIGVALVRRMKVHTSTDGKIISPRDQAQIFAYTLENSKWNMGSCEEDIVVFYSVDDKMLAIYTGLTASQRLTPYYKELIVYKVWSRLNDGRIVEALNHIIYDIKLVLNCEYPERHDCNLYEFNPNLACANLTSLSLVLVLAFVAMLSNRYH